MRLQHTQDVKTLLASKSSCETELARLEMFAQCTMNNVLLCNEVEITSNVKLNAILV